MGIAILIAKMGVQPILIPNGNRNRNRNRLINNRCGWTLSPISVSVIFSEQTTTAAVDFYLRFCRAIVLLLFRTIALGREYFSSPQLSPARGSGSR